MSNQQPITLTDRVRGYTKDFLSRIGKAVFRMGIHPDTITVMGLILVALSAIVIAGGDLQLGGIILFISLPLDAVDGAVARAMQRRGRFGEMLDSMLDRYADGFIFAGLSYYFAVRDDFGYMLLAMLALIGTFAVSYARARADGVDVSVKIGLFSRMERTVVILVMLLIPSLLSLGMWILAVGTNFTAMQRLWFVYRALKDREG